MMGADARFNIWDVSGRPKLVGEGYGVTEDEAIQDFVRSDPRYSIAAALGELRAVWFGHDKTEESL